VTASAPDLTTVTGGVPTLNVSPRVLPAVVTIFAPPIAVDKVNVDVPLVVVTKYVVGFE
jgi:hypothetical protein